MKAKRGFWGISLSAVLFFAPYIIARGKTAGILAADTYVISGKVAIDGAGLANVVMSGLPGDPATDASGDYSATVDSGWSGTVTPTLAGYGFIPASTEYSNVTSDQTTNYAAVIAYFTFTSSVIPANTYGKNAHIPFDFDLDGIMDLIVTQVDGAGVSGGEAPILAFHNDGSGHFNDVTAGVLGEVKSCWTPTWVEGDFNRDNLVDLFFADCGIDSPPFSGSKFILFIKKSNGTLADETTTRLPSVIGHPWVCSGGDIDGDGDLDLWVSATGGENYPLLNDGSGYFTNGFSRLPSDCRASVSLLVDVDKDGDLDVVCNDGTGGNQDYILLNDGLGFFTKASAATMPTHGLNHAIEHFNTSDVNGDGWPDLLLEEADTSSFWMIFRLYLNNQDGTFRDATDQIPQTNDLLLSCWPDSFSDFNNDGWMDFLAHDRFKEVFRLFINEGDGSFSEVTSTVFALRDFKHFQNTRPFDFDDDGDLDIAVGKLSKDYMMLYQNQQPYAIAAAPLAYPGTVTLQSPANGSVESLINPDLTWMAVATSTHYRLQIASDDGFSDIVIDQDKITSDNSWRPRGLAGSTTYYWRVRAINTRGTGGWSSVFHFTTPESVAISGQITSDGTGLAGVAMIGLPGSVQTDADGNYSVEVESGWTGTVRPFKEDIYHFKAEITSYSDLHADQTTDYVAWKGIPLHEREALMTFYNSTDGDNWPDNTGWKTPPLETDGFAAFGTENLWYGIIAENNLGSQTVIQIDANIASGTLPDIWASLPNVSILRLAGGPLTGPLPASLGGLAQMQLFNVGAHELSGDLPSWLGNFTAITQLRLNYNYFSGKIPAELGSCTKLMDLDLSRNFLSGEIPSSLANLTSCTTQFLIDYNALYTNDPTLKAFLDTMQPGWDATQTIAPSGIIASSTGATSVNVSWMPITYSGDSGGYRVYYGPASGGPYTFFGQTATKLDTSLEVTGLTAGTPYYFVVRTRTNAHANNKNIVDSESSAEATAMTPSILILTSPNGGEVWDAGSIQNITWTTAGTVGDVKLEYSTNSGTSWTTVIASTPGAIGQEKGNGTESVMPMTNSYAWALPAAASTTCLVRISEVGTSGLSDTSDAVFTIKKDKPIIGLSKTAFNFASIKKGKTTPVDTVLITNPGGGTLKWTAVSSQPWLSIAPKTGPANKTMKIKVVKASALAVGTYAGTITITDPNATNSPATINVTLVVKAEGTDAVPFGAFEKPADGATINTPTTAVSGWALDDVGMKWAKVYLKLSETKKKLIGTAKFIVGARPDIETAYPTYPHNNRAGWSYTLKMSKLPNKGVGTFTLLAYVQDLGGHQVLLGTHTITGVAPTGAAGVPFGDLDMPEDGGMASGGAYSVNGWTLAPPPGRIDRSSLTLWIDGLAVGHPEYGFSRNVIATDYPGHANSAKAGGSYVLDTTKYADGWHTIAWSAVDSSGAIGELGSRYFKIANSVVANNASGAEKQNAATVDPDESPIIGEAQFIVGSFAEIANIPEDGMTPLFVKRGFSDDQTSEAIYPDADGSLRIQIPQASRLAIYFNREKALEGEQEMAARIERILVDKNVSMVFGDRSKDPSPSRFYRVYALVGEELRPLPIGASFDNRDGILFWQPGPGFLGEHQFVIVDSASGTRKTIRITID